MLVAHGSGGIVSSLEMAQTKESCLDQGHGPSLAPACIQRLVKVRFTGLAGSLPPNRKQNLPAGCWAGWGGRTVQSRDPECGPCGPLPALVLFNTQHPYSGISRSQERP